MPKISVRFAESAIADLEALQGWYAKRGVSEVGERFVAEIVARIEALRLHPEMDPIVPEFDQPYLRELIHPPFRVVCRLDSRQAWIVRVWRGERLLALPRSEET